MEQDISRPVRSNDTPEQTSPPPQAPPEQTSSNGKYPRKRMLAWRILLLGLLLIAAGLLVYGYFMMQDLQAKLNDTQAELQAERQSQMATANQQTEDEKIANFGTFIGEYHKIQAASEEVAVDRNKEVALIEAALKQYYDMATLPEGWAVLNIYQITKPETPPSGDLHALIYWPADQAKPASFVEMVKAKGAKEWQFNESL